MLCSDFFLEPAAMMRPDAKVEKVYLYPKPVDSRKSIDSLAALAVRTGCLAIHQKVRPPARRFTA